MSLLKNFVNTISKKIRKTIDNVKIKYNIEKEKKQLKKRKTTAKIWTSTIKFTKKTKTIRRHKKRPSYRNK